GGLGGAFGGSSTAEIQAALKYVEAHGAGSRFGLIVSSETSAASAVIRGEPVASMGGFTGRETVLTSSLLSSLVRTGQARYFLLGGSSGFGAGTQNAAVQTITSTCTAVRTSAWTSFSSTGVLYDCAGKAS